ncbi:MAG: hypothetical protein ACE5HI_17620 [bacterium]
MKCPNKNKIIAYANGGVEDTDLSERIERHIQSCEKCEKLLETYRVLQEVGDEINPEPEKIDGFQMTPKLEAAIQTITTPTHWWDFLAGWTTSLRRPAWVVAGACVLLIAVLCIWNIRQNETSGTLYNIAGVPYRAWGDKDSLESLQLNDTPPALQSQQVSRHIGFLTESLIQVLQNPKITDDFWQVLSNALSEQKITMPPSLQTLVIEDSLFSDIRAKQAASNREIWILFYQGQIMFVRWSE